MNENQNGLFGILLVAMIFVFLGAAVVGSCLLNVGTLDINSTRFWPTLAQNAVSIFGRGFLAGIGIGFMYLLKQR